MHQATQIIHAQRSIVHDYLHRWPSVLHCSLSSDWHMPFERKVLKITTKLRSLRTLSSKANRVAEYTKSARRHYSNGNKPAWLKRRKQKTKWATNCRLQNVEKPKRINKCDESFNLDDRILHQLYFFRSRLFHALILTCNQYFGQVAQRNLVCRFVPIFKTGYRIRGRNIVSASMLSAPMANSWSTPKPPFWWIQSVVSLSVIKLRGTCIRSTTAASAYL